MAQRFYLNISARPRDVLRVIDQVTEEMGRYRGTQRWIWLSGIGLILAGLAFWGVDRVMDYAGNGFAFVAYFFWAVALVLSIYALVATMVQWPSVRGKIATPAITAFMFGVPFSIVCLGTSFVPRGIVFMLVALGAVLGAILAVERAPRMPGGQLKVAREILHTLRDDVGRRGRYTGWLDLTGPQQKSKLMRTGRSRSGNVKRYYSDPWLSAKIHLVDGNLLRLTLADRLKVKKGSIAGRRHQIKAKLVVDDRVYEIGPGQDLPGLIVDGSILQLEATNARPLTAKNVLASLKAMYSYLEPRQPVTPIA